MCTDAPQLPEWFSRLVLKPLMDAKRVALKDVKWLQVDDDIYNLGGHFELIAYLVYYKDKELGSMK
jgi:hypothetical protein